MIKKPHRGEIWLVELDPTRGHEQAKKRPCVVISHDSFNQGASGLVVILPLTSKFKKNSWLVLASPPEGGLDVTSYIICYQIRTVALERFAKRPLGVIKSDTMEAILARLRILLALDI